MHELSEAIHRDKSTVTALVNKLKEQGYVERIQSESDSRVVYVRLTEKGKAYTVETGAISSALNEKCFAGFTESQKDALYEFLARISKNFAE